MKRMGLMLGLLPLLWMTAQAMPVEEARHLLARTGFGITPAQLSACAALDYDQAVKGLLDGVRTTALTPPPDWVDDPVPTYREANKAATEEERREKKKELQRLMKRNGQDLKGWWYQEMLATDSQLTERMTLFWHNHFTSSLQKVKAPNILFQQNALLRRLAFGNFRDLLLATSQDPAMVIYLDSGQNRKGKPNENYARELLELFTLGEGHYTEDDIKAAARAFTGYGANRTTGEFVPRAKLHDEGEKTFMGRTGNFDGNDIIDIILAQPRAAEYVIEKLWREFISDTPDPAEARRLAGVFRDNNYEIKPLLAALFTSPKFRDPANRGVLVKSPAELMVGTLRTFEIPMNDTMLLVIHGRQMGQDILDPPNVKGWPGGTDWINTSALLARRQFLERALRGQDLERRGRGDREGGDEMQMASMPPADSPMEKRVAELRAEGLKGEALRRRIREEVAAGKLERPDATQKKLSANRPAAPDPEMRKALRKRTEELKAQGMSREQIREQLRGERQKLMAERRGGEARMVANASGEAMSEMTAQEPRPGRGSKRQTGMPATDAGGWMRQLEQSGLGAGKAELVLLPIEPTMEINARDDRERIEALLLDPAYQLK